MSPETEKVQEAIRNLHLAEIEGLLQWLQSYCDDVVWDKETMDHLNRLGPEKLAEVISEEEPASERVTALEVFTLRVMLRHLHPMHRTVALACLRHLIGGDVFPPSRYRAVSPPPVADYPVDAA